MGQFNIGMQTTRQIANQESLGIFRVASIHLFVRDLERTRNYYVKNLGLTEIARSTPEFEKSELARASVVEAGGARFVIIEPLGTQGESYQWLRKHPDGIGRLVFDVKDLTTAYQILDRRGATFQTEIEERVVEGKPIAWFDIATPIGDTAFRFIHHSGSAPVLPNLQRIVPEAKASDTVGYGDVDHITSNFLTLQPAIRWMQEVMGFDVLWDIEFHSQNESMNEPNGTGLKSIVMWDSESHIKFANNEPLAPNYKSSQTFLFCEDNKGAGIQHIALTVEDIKHAVGTLKNMGGQFMPTPSSYYDSLTSRLNESGVGSIEENIDELRDLEVLVDGEAASNYLLQIFMKDAASIFADANAGPFFLELIQRKGDEGFGGGNFRALFDSIEGQQKVSGRT